MLKFVSQRSFGEFARHRVSADNDLGRPTVLSSLVLWEGTPNCAERSEPTLGNPVHPGSLRSEAIRRGKEGIGSRSAHSRHPDGTAVLRGIHNSLMEKRLPSITLLGHEPVYRRAVVEEVESTAHVGFGRQLHRPLDTDSQENRNIDAHADQMHGPDCARASSPPR